MRSVLIIASVFPPENYSGAARPGRFAKFLPEFGYRPYVVCLNHGRPGDDPTIERVPSAATNRRSVRLASKAGQLIQRYALPYTDELPWVPHAVDAGYRMIRSHAVDAVISTSPPIATHLAALWLRRKTHVKWIADFRDPLYGNPFRNRKWIFDYDGRVERSIFRNADYLIGNTDSAVDAWRKRCPEWSRKMDFIWNGFDPQEKLDPAPLVPRRRRILSHVGALYGLREPRTLIDSVDRLIARGLLDPESLSIQLIGHVEPYLVRDDDPAVSRLRELGCLWYDRQNIPKAAAQQKTAESDFLLLLDSAGGLQVPAKVFDYLRVCRPILAFTNPGSPVDRILRDSGVRCACVYPDASAERADEQILDFLNAPASPTAPNEWFWREFDGRLHTQKLAAMLDSLLKV